MKNYLPKTESNIGCLVYHGDNPCPGYPDPKPSDHQECNFPFCEIVEHDKNGQHKTTTIEPSSSSSEFGKGDKPDVNYDWFSDAPQFMWTIYTMVANDDVSECEGFIYDVFHKEIQQARREVVEEIKKHFETMVFDNSGDDKLINIMEFRKEQSKYLEKLK